MKTEKFPLTVTEAGVSAKIYRGTQTHKGTKYRGFIVTYSLLGKRKQVWRSELPDAKTAARDACTKIANGEQAVLQLTNHDRMTYLRAAEAVAPVQTPIDVACREFATAFKLLEGRGTLTDAVQFYVKAQSKQPPTISVAAAVDEMLLHSERDGKSRSRMHQLETYLTRFKDAFSCNLRDIESRHIADYIVGLKLMVRTKKNCRDILKAFFQWCVLRGYLLKDEDMMANVQRYSSRITTEIEIFTPDELTKMIKVAKPEMLPYIVIQAFAGIRGKEIQRLDWSVIDLVDGFIEVRGDASKTGVRRLVPIKPNLKAWLLKIQPANHSGPVCKYKNLANEIFDLSTDSGVAWKRNGLRHSFISYRVAECADVPRVADEAGNSVTVIRTNYLRRVKPAQATEWFNIKPEVQP